MFTHFGGGATLPEIGHSLRFNSADTAYLSKTISGAADQKIGTLSLWVKRSELAVALQPLLAADKGSSYDQIGFDSNDTIAFITTNGTVQQNTTAVFRDPTAWYHIVVGWDTTQAVAGNRTSIEVNGVVQTLTGTGPALNRDMSFGAAVAQYLGKRSGAATYFGGYISRVCLVYGSKLPASSFAYTDPNGQWRSLSASACKTVVDAGGTNSFMLDFDDGSSTTTLGYDYSAKNNNWTLTNFTRSAGVDDDWLEDTPTNNFCTLNRAVASAANISNGALASGTTAVRGTQDALAIGGYWEVTAGASNVTAGVISESDTTNTTTVTANKTFGFRLSAAGALDYINITDAGAWTSITTGLSGAQFPYGTTAAANWNFGQRAFSGSCPTGFKALCTKNLPAGSATTSGSFTGNAAADGPFVWLNGTPTAMTINGNAVTFGTHADKLANGFKLRTNSASYNASGSNTYSVSTNAGVFKYNNAEGNP